MLNFLRKLFRIKPSLVTNTSSKKENITSINISEEPIIEQVKKSNKTNTKKESIKHSPPVQELNATTQAEKLQMKKFLIAGLGNIGPKYQNTRHNIGFKVLDYIAASENLTWQTAKLGDITTYKFKGRTFILLKPSTYMNLSGKAVKYWMDKEKIDKENILVVTDDLNLPFASFRIKPKGSSGGHNGLQNIQDTFSSGAFPRFRFGISNAFSKGRQVDYVLGKWTAEEESVMIERVPKAMEAIKSFAMSGINITMNTFNGN